MQKLPTEFKEKWVAALRSGEFKQGRGALYKNGKYCCLGVADKIEGYEPDARDSILKHHENVPEIIRGDTELTARLATMNDEGGKSFSEIADYIEQNL